MANKASNYDSGQGLPPYLLWRYNSDSTDYSDGASGIFLSSIETASTRGSSCSSMSIDTCGASSACSWSTTTDPCAISVVLNSTELETNSSRCGFLVNEETRTIRSIRESIDNGSEVSSSAIDLNESVNRESDKDSSNIISSTGIPIILATFVTNYRNESVDVPSNNDFVSNFYTDPETMFPPYELYLDQNVEEEQWKESIGKLNYLVVSYTIIMIIFRKHAMR